jgi:hypothetical protein
VLHLLKAVPESLFRFTDADVRALAGFFSKPLMYFESGFRKPLHRSTGGFSKLDMTVNIHSFSSAAYQKGFHINNRLTETQYKLSVSGFSKVLKNYEINKFKNHKRFYKKY